MKSPHCWGNSIEWNSIIQDCFKGIYSPLAGKLIRKGNIIAAPLECRYNSPTCWEIHWNGNCSSWFVMALLGSHLLGNSWMETNRSLICHGIFSKCSPPAGEINWMETTAHPYPERCKLPPLGNSIEWVFPVAVVDLVKGELLKFSLHSSWGNQLNGNTMLKLAKCSIGLPPNCWEINWIETSFTFAVA